MGYRSGNDEPVRPVVNRPRGAAWRALQADGVAWEGQVLVLGADVGLAARLIVTTQRLALARGGAVVLEVARAWLRPAPELQDPTTIRLSITPESPGPETETIDLQVRDGAQATRQLLALLAGEGGGWGPATASPSLQTRPPQAAADAASPRPSRAGELPRQALWTDIGQPEISPVPNRRAEPAATAATTRMTSPSMTVTEAVTVTDDAQADVVRVPAPFATTRDYDWNLRPVRGMVDRSTRRRRGWGLRLGGLILLLAVAAYAGAMGVPSQPLDQVDRLTGGGASDPTKAPEATTVAQISPARGTQTPSPAPGSGISSGNAPTATLSPAEQTAVALGVGGGDDEDPTASSEPAIGDIPPTATSEPPAATAPPTVTPTSTPEVAPPGVPTSADPPPTVAELPAVVATVESTSLPAVPPTAVPTAAPTAAPTIAPTAEPTMTATVAPTAEPTLEPTATAEPTLEPTATAEPTTEPTATVAPTAEPTPVPTIEPTLVPTEKAAAEATAEPTAAPTPTEVVEPTAQPTVPLTIEPTAEPTIAPTTEPTAVPTAAPTAAPTATSTPRPTPTAAAEPTATAEPTAIVVVEPPVTVTSAPAAEPTTPPTQAASEPAPTEDAAPSPTATSPAPTATALPTQPPAPTATALPTQTPPPSPTAAPTETPTPAATVPAQKPSLARNEIPDQVAVDGPFRFTLEVVERGEQLPDFALPPGNGEWVALVVHVRNWTDTAATLHTDDLSLIAEPDGTAIPLDSGTGFIASAIGFDPAYGAGDSVAIAPGDGQRLALVFLAPPGTTDVRLATGGTTIALDAAIDVSIGVGSLGDPPAEPGLLRGTVVRVIDGQTIAVEIDGAETEVRYLGIKAPVGDDCWASEATTANADLVDGQTVWIERERSSSDKKDRWLRDVYVNQNGALTLVSARLIAQGAATVAITAPDTRFDGWLRALSASAESDGAGLWGACGEQAERSPDGSALLRTWVSHALTAILPPEIRYGGPVVQPTPL